MIFFHLATVLFCGHLHIRTSDHQDFRSFFSSLLKNFSFEVVLKIGCLGPKGVQILSSLFCVTSKNRKNWNNIVYLTFPFKKKICLLFWSKKKFLLHSNECSVEFTCSFFFFTFAPDKYFCSHLCLRGEWGILLSSFFFNRACLL
jgi:hypothetical protein